MSFHDFTCFLAHVGTVVVQDDEGLVVSAVAKGWCLLVLTINLPEEGLECHRIRRVTRGEDRSAKDTPNGTVDRHTSHSSVGEDMPVPLPNTRPCLLLLQPGVHGGLVDVDHLTWVVADHPEREASEDDTVVVQPVLVQPHLCLVRLLGIHEAYLVPSVEVAQPVRRQPLIEYAFNQNTAFSEGVGHPLLQCERGEEEVFQIRH